MTSRAWWTGGMLLLSMIFLTGFLVFRPTASYGPAQRKAVVVELFTSEGCSSCPPADEPLARLGREQSANGAQIIPLGFHVDYWDFQGWRDRFSSHAYTERQESYAARFRLEGPYTPQMVVDGQMEFVGNDSGRAQEAIAKAAAQPQQAGVRLSPAAGKLQVHVEGTDGTASGDVFFVITEDDLSSNVAAGENNGHILHHAAVVRDFRRLGQLQAGRFEQQIAISSGKDWKNKDLHLVVFVQSGPNGPIAGAASLPASSLATGK